MNNDLIRITFAGYNQKLGSLIKLVMGQFSKLDLREERFEIQKEKLNQYFQNAKNEQPYSHARDNASLIFRGEAEFGIEELEPVLPKLNFEQFKAFVPTITQNVSADVLSHGNILKKTTVEYVNLIKDSLNLTFGPKYPQIECAKLRRENKQSHYIYAHGPYNPNEKNCATHTTFEVNVDEDPKLYAMTRFYSFLANPHCFTYLRTKKQLGYIVWSSAELILGVTRFSVIVQSSEFTPNQIDVEVENFLKLFEEENLANMSEEEFAEKRQQFILDITKKHKKLSELTSRYWYEIIRNRYEFERKQDLADEVAKLTKEDLLNFSKTFLNKNSKTRTKLSNWVYGREQKIEKPEEDSLIWIEDFHTWRKKLPKYPYPYPRAGNVQKSRL